MSKCTYSPDPSILLSNTTLAVDVEEDERSHWISAHVHLKHDFKVITLKTYCFNLMENLSYFFFTHILRHRSIIS